MYFQDIETVKKNSKNGLDLGKVWGLLLCWFRSFPDFEQMPG